MVIHMICSQYADPDLESIPFVKCFESNRLTMQLGTFI